MAYDISTQTQPARLAPDTRIAAVVSTYHGELTGAMLASAERTLVEAGLTAGSIEVHTAPGAFELPLLARRLAARGDVHAVLAFGLVLKGETRHDVVVADGAAQGILRASLDTDVPILLGVLTCDTLDQARARALAPAEGGELDKGREVARACIHTLSSLGAIDARSEEEQP